MEPWFHPAKGGDGVKKGMKTGKTGGKGKCK